MCVYGGGKKGKGDGGGGGERREGNLSYAPSFICPLPVQSLGCYGVYTRLFS